MLRPYRNGGENSLSTTDSPQSIAVPDGPRRPLRSSTGRLVRCFEGGWPGQASNDTTGETTAPRPQPAFV
jgi:hypothetical protein